jgi:hypothetical protein
MSAPYMIKKRTYFTVVFIVFALIGAFTAYFNPPVDSNTQVLGAQKKVIPTPKPLVIKKKSIPTPKSRPVVTKTPTKPVATTSLSGLKVQGNKLVNSNGQTVRLFGANRSGTEYMCLGGGFSDGPTDVKSLQAMQSWHLNTVRVPLNESCWLGINGASFGGAPYQAAVKQYVDTITANNMVAILDLHWNAPGDIKAEGQNPMPDADHTPTFWKEVATTFKSNDKVIFDLFNEPDPIPYRDDYPGGFSQWQQDDFNCLLNGCEVTTKTGGVKYQAVGMQSLVDTVRATGATNILMIAGIQSAQTITQYQGNQTTTPKGYMPVDPLNNLAVAMHQYNRAACSDVACWESTVAPVAKVYPVITGEFGDTDCTADYTKVLLPWLDKYGISYVGWTWDTWPQSCEALIKDYSGTPSSPYGQAYRDHLNAIH